MNMKKFVSFLVIILIAVSVFAFYATDKGIGFAKSSHDDNQKKFPVITFEKAEHDFGEIPHGVPVETVFGFTNTGDAPLVITNVSSSCGCTIPEKPEGVILPGEKSEIKVSYNASGNGQVTKIVHVESNTASGRDTVKIKAFVKKTED